ncbi:MAG: inositol monophosphatase family protein [Nocardioides sp.]
MDVSSLWDELEDLLLPMLSGFRSRGLLRVERKADATLLSEADEPVQDQIVRCVRAVDPDGLIVGEEAAHGADRLLGRGPSERAWVIDPIDGTAQFVADDGREFCSVVCLIEDSRPVAAFVLAPEIGPGRSRVCVRLAGAGEPIEINGTRVVAGGASPVAHASCSVDEPGPLVSVTRSKSTPARSLERALAAGGYQLKTRTTSQTLDMIRTCVDLAPFTEPALASFGMFYRERQKIWDGVAGMCFAYAAGLYVGDGTGRARTEVDIALDLADPVFDSMLIAWDLAAVRILTGAEVPR